MKCSKTDCEHVATHAPKLCVPAEGATQGEGQRLEMVLNVRLCCDHACAFDVAAMLDLADGALRGALPILARMQGMKGPPDPARAWVVALPLAGGEFLAYERAVKKPH